MSSDIRLPSHGILGRALPHTQFEHRAKLAHTLVVWQNFHVTFFGCIELKWVPLLEFTLIELVSHVLDVFNSLCSQMPCLAHTMHTCFLYSFQVYIINCLNLVWKIPYIGPLVPLHIVTHNKLISSTLSLKLKVEVWWCLEFGTKTCEDPSKMHWMIHESVHESLHWMDRGSNPIWNEYVSELANFVYKWTQKEIWSNLRDVRAIWKNRPKNQNVCKKRLWIGIVEKTKVNLRQLVKVRVNDQGKESQWSIVVKGSV